MHLPSCSTFLRGNFRKIIFKEIIKKTKSNLEFDIVSNPEFLREGSAIEDFMRPDRVVVGFETEKSNCII